MKKILFFLSCLLFLISCSKESVIKKDSQNTLKATTTVCGQYDNISAGQYFLMNNIWGSGAGSQCIWYTSTNSWGANSSHVGSGIKSYPALVRGCHWGNCSSGSGLPKQISALSSSLATSWTQSSSATAYDAAYDIWFDASSNPGGRAATYELMIWTNWANTQPIAASYNSSGVAVPSFSNVSVGGVTFNVYRRGNVFSFLRTSKSNSINVNLKSVINYCVTKGWLSNSHYLISVQCGWEIITGGTFKTTAYSVSNL